DVQPTWGFQRTLQRAVSYVQASGRREVAGINTLVSLFSERDSIAVKILAEEGIDRDGLLRQLGETVWDDVPANACVNVGLVEHRASTAAFTMRTSQSEIEKRLDAVE